MAHPVLLIVLLGLVLALPILALYNLIYALASKEGRQRHLIQFAIYSVVTVVVFGWAILSPGYIKAPDQGKLTACKSNLKNIATACEMYSTDFKGHYPPTLSLLTPNYLKVIPNCSAAKSDTYSATYQSTPPSDEQSPEEQVGGAYTFYCRGKNHEKASNTPENFPQYSSYQGLIDRP